MATMEERRALIQERMERRAEERSAVIGQRRADLTRHGHQNEQENAGVFMDSLNADAQRVKDSLKLETMRKLSPDEQSIVFSEVAESISLLNRRLTESTMFLPSFDVEQSREIIQTCQQQLLEVRALLQPKKKFAFARNRPRAPAAAAKVTAVPDSAPAAKPKAAPVLGDYGAAQRSGEEIVLLECAGKDLFLSELRDCRVRLGSGGKAMRFDRLRSCHVVSGPTAGSIFIDDCEDCVFVVACQQLRIHTTHRSAFYIHVTARAIIEFCSDLQFAPYTVNPKLDVQRQLGDVGLNAEANNWDKVEDFCHLAIDVPSPNWRIMPDEERQSFELH